MSAASSTRVPATFADAEGGPHAGPTARPRIHPDHELSQTQHQRIKEDLMDIDVQARDFRLTEALREAIYLSAIQYRATFRRLVKKVAVRVYDLNGPRGGLDKGCLVVADLADGRVIVCSDVDQDLYRAIPRAFAKLKRGTQAARRRLQAQRRSAALEPA